MIAGEDPELCFRLRAAGWRVWRLDAEMTLHDAAMTHFGQWWRRVLRSGYAFAHGAYLHGTSPERHWVWESRRAWIWGVWLPLGCLTAGLIFWPWGWATLANLSIADSAADRTQFGTAQPPRNARSVSAAWCGSLKP